MRGKIISLLSCLVGGVSIILILFYISADYNDRKNNFVRLFPPHAAYMQNVRDLGVNSFYFAGSAQGKVYLATNTAVRLLLTVSTNLKDTAQQLSAIPDRKGIFYQYLNCVVDSPVIYYVDEVGKNVIKGKISSDSFTVDSLPAIAIDKIVPASPDLLGFYTYDRRKDIAAIRLFSPLTMTVRPGSYIFEKQGAGFFSSDGVLLFDKPLQLFIYTFLYKNKCIVLDTNLTVLHTFSTIDTNSYAKVKSVYIASSDKLAMSAPPPIVNKGVSCFNGKLFIWSGLRADNEKKSTFEGSDVIDVYSETLGKYLYSFYLPRYNARKLQSFLVRDSSLVGIYNRYLVSYKLTLL